MAHATMEGINKLLSITINEQSVCFGELLKIFISLSNQTVYFIYIHIYPLLEISLFFPIELSAISTVLIIICLNFNL